MLITTDQEGGNVYRLGTGTALPGNMALGATYATNGTKYAKEAGKIIGSELSALGINTNMLTGVTLFMADISDDGRINIGDVSKLYAHIKGTNLLAWDT